MASQSRTPNVSSTIQALLDKPNVSKNAHKIPHLPPLTSLDVQDIRHLPVPQSDEEYFPLRLCLGRVQAPDDPDDAKIWMYISRTGHRADMMRERNVEGGNEPYLEEFKLEKDNNGNITTPGVELAEPFNAGRGGGKSHYPMSALAKYYLLRAYEDKGIDLQPDEFRMDRDAKVGQYFATGVNAYYKTISVPEESEGEVDDVVESFQPTDEDQASRMQQDRLFSPIYSSALPSGVLITGPPSSPFETTDTMFDPTFPHGDFGPLQEGNPNAGLGLPSVHSPFPFAHRTPDAGLDAGRPIYLREQFHTQMERLQRHLEDWEERIRDVQRAAAEVRKSLEALRDAENMLSEEEDRLD